MQEMARPAAAAEVLDQKGTHFDMHAVTYLHVYMVCVDMLTNQD